MKEAEYYTPPQAARVLGLSRRRVTQMLNDGTLIGEKLGNGRWKIPYAAVGQLLKQRSQKPLPPPSRAPVDKMVEEVKERSAMLEGRAERLANSLSRLFDRLEHLEDRLSGLEERLINGQSHRGVENKRDVSNSD
jgi:excisionase family DNA binding protein